MSLAAGGASASDGRDQGCTISWVAAGSGQYDDPANWDLGRVPNLFDEVCITKAGTFTVTVDDTEFPVVADAADELTVGGTPGQPTLSISGATLTVDNTGGVAQPVTNSGIITTVSSPLGTLFVAAGAVRNTWRFANDGSLDSDLVNDGTFTGSLTLAGRTWTNNQTMTAAAVPATLSGTDRFVAGGGILFISSTLTVSSGGNLDISGGSIDDSALVTVGAGGTLTVSAGSLAGTGPVVQGGSLVGGGPGPAFGTVYMRGAGTIGGAIPTSLTVIIQANDAVGSTTITAPSSFSSDGYIRLDAAGTASQSVELMVSDGVGATDETFTNTGTLELIRTGTSGSTILGGDLDNVDAVIVESPDSTFDRLSENTGIYTNSGNISVYPGGSLIINGAGNTYSQTGVLSVQGTCAILGGATFTNFAGTTLTGGSYGVTGTFRFSGADIVTNAANITLQGTAAQILDEFGADGVSGLSTNAVGASLDLLAGRSLTVTGPMSNAGTLNIQDSSFTSTGNYTQTAGATYVIGGASALTATGGTVSINAGSLTANGTIGPALRNSGTLDPILPGVLTVAGSYVQTANGILSIEVAGPTPGTNLDQLSMTGAATLAGNLTISNQVFVPALGTNFPILTTAARTGAFATVTRPLVRGSLLHVPVYGPGGVVLTILNPGSGSASGDFNADGFVDLANGVPGEGVGAAGDAGAVNVIYGSPPGLAAGANQLWSQASPGILEVPEVGDRFGQALAAGDFNLDGFEDLAIGVPGEDVGLIPDAGAVHVIYGGPGGLAPAGNQLWTQDTAGILDASELGDGFGGALASANFGMAPMDDLAIGVAGEDVATASDAGSVNVLYGTPAGLAPAGNQVWSQDSPGILDLSEADDWFGVSLAAGMSLGVSPESDLAVGASGEDGGPVVDAGAVNVIYGSPAGLAAGGNQFWNQNVGTILDTAEAGDQFGASLACANFSGDGIGDLAVGVPRENVGAIADAGVANVIYGAPGGLTDVGNQLWGQGVGGILDSGEAFDLFGWAVGGANFGVTPQGDLAIGVPSEDVGAIADAGAVAVIYGAPGGLVAGGNQIWTQNSGGVVDVSEAGDFFGASLTVGSFGATPEADLVIAVPAEDVGAVPNGGAASVLYGAAGGLAPGGNQIWSQDSPGILDVAEPEDRLGSAVG